jgi:hypothetical protein
MRLAGWVSGIGGIDFLAMVFIVAWTRAWFRRDVRSAGARAAQSAKHTAIG